MLPHGSTLRNILLIALVAGFSTWIAFNLLKHRRQLHKEREVSERFLREHGNRTAASIPAERWRARESGSGSTLKTATNNVKGVQAVSKILPRTAPGLLNVRLASGEVVKGYINQVKRQPCPAPLTGNCAEFPGGVYVKLTRALDRQLPMDVKRYREKKRLHARKSP